MGESDFFFSKLNVIQGADLVSPGLGDVTEVSPKEAVD